MGQTVTQLCENNPSCTVVAGFDINDTRRADYPVYSDPTGYLGPADAVIDFFPSLFSEFSADSTARSAVSRLFYARPATLPGRKRKFARAAFADPGLSVGQHVPRKVNVLLELVKQAAVLLGSDWDI
jgi:dihydrodipicolinate reductase